MDIRPERSKFRKINKPMVFSVILFTALVIWLIVSVGSAGTAAEKSRSSSVYKTVMNSALLCYSIEGEYPPDLDYLKENYGVRIDSEKYTVHYEYFGYDKFGGKYDAVPAVCGLLPDNNFGGSFGIRKDLIEL